MSKLVCVRSYPTRLEAEYAKSLLESCKIRAMVMADDAGGARPYPVLTVGYARLLVNEEDAKEAVAILQAQGDN